MCDAEGEWTVGGAVADGEEEFRVGKNPDE